MSISIIASIHVVYLAIIDTKETLCPITLYELGKQSASNKPIFIGIHPDYKRKRDVEIQTKLIRPEIKIVYSLNDLAKQMKDWSNHH